MARKVLSALVCGAALLTSYTPMLGDDLDRQARALKLIRETAADICSTVQQEGSRESVDLSGDVKAKLGGAIARIADLGIEGAAKYKTEQFKGVLQTEVAGAVKDNAQCRLDVLKLLNDKLLGPTSPPPQKGSNNDANTNIVEIIKSRAGSCSLGQAINNSGTKFLDVCLCVNGYDETRRTLNYQIKIKGRDSVRGRSLWAKYEYNTSAIFDSPVKLDSRSKKILVHADTRDPVLRVGPKSTVDIFFDDKWNKTISGNQAFWWAYTAALNQDPTVPEANKLNWSMPVTDGPIILGQESTDLTFAVESIARCGF